MVCWGIFFNLLTLSKKITNFALNALPLTKRTKKVKQSKQDIVKFQENETLEFNIIDNDVWINLLNKLSSREKNETVNNFVQSIHSGKQIHFVCG